MLNPRTSVRVSYIITTRNRARFLDKALENVREFTTAEDEVIIMDGGSTDETSEVIRKHEDIVTLFVSEPDYGEAHGFNKGILESRGRYIKVITDDDYFFPEAMKQCIAVMEEHPELDAVICGGEEHRFDPDANQYRLTRYQYLPETRSLNDDVDNVSLFVTCGIGLVLTRRLISRLGLFDTSFHAIDRDYLAKMMTTPIEFKYLNLKLWRHVVHPHSGENDEAKCERDRLRLAMRYGWWNKTVLYPPQDLCHAFGLDTQDNGMHMIEVLKEAEWLRQKMPRLLKLLVGSLGLFHRVCYLGGIVVRAFRHLIGVRPKYSVADLLKEPEWDGNLR